MPHTTVLALWAMPKGGQMHSVPEHESTSAPADIAGRDSHCWAGKGLQVGGSGKCSRQAAAGNACNSQASSSACETRQERFFCSFGRRRASRRLNRVELGAAAPDKQLGRAGSYPPALAGILRSSCSPWHCGWWRAAGPCPGNWRGLQRQCSRLPISLWASWQATVGSPPTASALARLACTTHW